MLDGILNKKRLIKDDDFDSARRKISERIPGVQTAIIEIGEVSKKCGDDPMRTLRQLDDARVYGADLWTLYKVVCQEDAGRVIGVMEKWSCGDVSDKQLRQAIRDEIVGLADEQRIQPSDDPEAARRKISDGKLGVSGALIEMETVLEKQGRSGVDILNKLDKAKLYGSDVALFYKTVCKEDPAKAVEVMDRWSEGSISDKQLHHAVHNQGDGLVESTARLGLKRPIYAGQIQSAPNINKVGAGVAR
jgi:hypothetical protein